MQLTDSERAVLDGAEGEVKREALDYIVQFGEAFDAPCLVDISYCHYPAEMGIYAGSVEDAVAYAERCAAESPVGRTAVSATDESRTEPSAPLQDAEPRARRPAPLTEESVPPGIRVAVPTTTSTLCCDLQRPGITGCPPELEALQAKVEGAHRRLGMLETYTCTPQQLGFIPPLGSYIVSVESSAIIYFNSVLGARTNRGGLLTRFSAICGKYPLMGYLLTANRRGTHLFNVEVPPLRLRTCDGWSALGFHIGALVGSAVPVLQGLPPQIRQEWLISLGAALATSGAVTLFHIPGVTPEARSVEEAFQGGRPEATFTVTERDLDAVYEKMGTIPRGAAVDFVTLGCPHYNLEQLRVVAELLRGRRVADGVRMWVCTNRMTRAAAASAGYAQAIEQAGALVVADTCPVESHMRQSTCREYGLAVPNISAMVTDSVKMARYVGDLIGCRTALTDVVGCIAAGLSGRWQ